MTAGMLQVRHALCRRGGRRGRGFDMAMPTSDLSCMVAGARMRLDALRSRAD
jgi:hypothetical protein